jgi:MoxR-like ATPase
MQLNVVLRPAELPDFLLNVAVVRPVFIWGAPGIGKSSLVTQFAASLGMPCVSMLGSQLAPEDLIGVPQVQDGVSRFCPPAQIVHQSPFCLFLDELNACTQEVQKAFYSLIHEQRIGEYHLPKGSIVIGAGNRAQDSAIVRPMSSALINRLVHVELKADHRDWLVWARQNGVHPLVLEYLEQRPDHIWSAAPKTEEPFSTPRSWHMLSDVLLSYGENLTQDHVKSLAAGCLTPAHATQFGAYHKLQGDRFRLAGILKGTANWPSAPEDRDLLYFLAQALRAQLIKELPREKSSAAHRAKAVLTDLAGVSYEMAQLAIAPDDQGNSLPDWFLLEVVRELPRLAQARG